MTTTTRKPEARSARVMQLGTSTILWLTSGKLTTAYRVRLLACQLGGRAFRLEKADQGDGPPEDYDVLVNGQHSTCECKGFSRWGHCKHVDGLTAVLAAGRLSAGAPVRRPALPEDF